MSRCVLKGVVLRCASDKTSVVRVARVVSHPRYRKKIRRYKKYLAHDEGNRCQKGDYVTIQENRPFSKLKTFEVVHIEKESGK